MSDKDVSQDPSLDANAQKPKYEAPAIIDLSGSDKEAGGICWGGSGDSDDCMDGASASRYCATGFAAVSTCNAGDGH